MEHLELRAVNVTIEEKNILTVDSARFENGIIYGVVGPSGSGKSTFLRVINFLEKPAQGWMNFWGQEANLAALSHSKSLPLQRQMAFVAQKPVMFQTTVFDNVAIGLRYRGVDKETVRAQVMSALHQVDMQHSAKQQATTLSGGEAQRIALARAIVLKPRLLLLDEPTANLDPYNISIFERAIKDICNTQKTTIIIVTHNLPQAKRLSDICLFIHKGKIVETKETAAFFSGPATSELQDFISGRMIY